MLRFFKIRYLQFLEHSQQKGFISALKFTFFKEEEAVPVEKDLLSLGALKRPTDETGISLIDLSAEKFFKANLSYSAPSRMERAARYFKKGYRTFVLVKDNKVIGDLWYVTRAEAKTKIIHPHLKWFGRDLNFDEVYMFDMYFTPDERGKALSTFFMSSVLHKMKEKGFKRAYGYFAAHNFPALWVHRLVGFKELPRFVIRRYFLYETCKAKG